METGSKIKTSLSEMGVTDAASGAVSKIGEGTKAIGGFLYLKARDASETIGQNETVNSAKEATKETLGSIKDKLSWGWKSFYSSVVKYEREDEDDDENDVPANQTPEEAKHWD